MGVGLWLEGEYKADSDVEGFLGQLESWVDHVLAADEVWGNLLTRCRVGQTHDGHRALFVHLHPACQDVEFVVRGPGQLTVLAKTSTGGPGYHTAVCQIVRRVGEEIGITWLPEGED